MALDSITLTHILSFVALGVSITVLVATIYFSTKNLKVAKNVLDVSKQQIKQNSYFQAIEIVNKSKHGYESLAELRTFLDSYQGILVDDEIRKFVDSKRKEIDEFEKESPFREPEPVEPTEEQINEYMKDQQEEIESMSPEERYKYEFDQNFGNTKNELLELIYRKLKEMTEKIDE